MNGQNGASNNSPQQPDKQQPGRLALGTKLAPKATAADSKLVRTEAFDQPIILQQPNTWSRAILWGIVGVATFTVGWASLAKIDEAVPAQGQLQAQSATQPVQAPFGGVVEEILVRDGQAVKQGDVLVRLDPTAAAAEQRSLEQVRNSLIRQNQFYRSQLAGGSTDVDLSQLNLPPEILSLTKNRAALVAENQLYQAQLSGSADAANLTAEQRIRVQAGLSESQSRAAAAQFKVSQLQQQLSQTQAQLASARASLEIDQSIYNDLAPLLEDGGIARVQVVRQEQQVIQSRGEVDRLAQEEARLNFAISEAQQQLANTVALSNRDLLDRMAANSKQIADIDSQLNKLVLDNDKTIAETESRLSQAQQTLKYQELRAPVDGVVFDLQAKGAGYVANSTEPILKIVPSNALVAEVYVTNQDIGFVAKGMPVDVRVDSFPFSEFGDIRGEIVTLGSDALPPDQTYNFYRFPARIELDSQTINVNGTEIPLQAGMSVSANIITRKRSVLSIFTDQFSRKIDRFQNVR
ncbi:MAG: HlyD family efflux transporter periplasmic adaptor subunit [Elainella sp. Prado103]|jgi:HlyD family secretion protein|nr:HlyD family efflux transporter periplasmic adaptor subunit [Elainella sp. Prado103]